MKVEMDIVGENYGAAKILAEQCKNVEPQDVAVILQNCNSFGDKRELVKIWASSWDWDNNRHQLPDDELKIMKAVIAIRDIADINGYDLIISVNSCDYGKNLEAIYKKCGFKYINDGTEMLRKYSLVKHLKHKIKANLRDWLAD